MRGAAPWLVVAVLLPLEAGAQDVADCDPAPPVTALIEPWEGTAVALAEGAVRLAVIEGEEGTRRLLVLTLPPPEAPPGPAPDGEEPVAEPAAPDPAAPPPERLCRIVAEGALGFADIDLAGLEAAEDAEAGALAVRIPVLGFLPESSELVPHTLVLTLGAADGTLAAVVE